MSTLLTPPRICAHNVYMATKTENQTVASLRPGHRLRFTNTKGVWTTDRSSYVGGGDVVEILGVHTELRERQQGDRRRSRVYFILLTDGRTLKFAPANTVPVVTDGSPVDPMRDRAEDEIQRLEARSAKMAESLGAQALADRARDWARQSMAVRALDEDAPDTYRRYLVASSTAYRLRHWQQYGLTADAS